jgi:hypothetical protein
VKSDGKVMATVFREHEGLLLLDCMQQVITINAGAYYTTLEPLRAAIERKHPELLTTTPGRTVTTQLLQRH